MKISEVKENLGKDVIYKPQWSEKEQEYMLNAYIYRVDPRNPKKRISQLELQDTQCGNSVMIVAMESVKTKEEIILKLRKNDKVTITGTPEEKTYEGDVFEITSDPYIVCGSEVVKMKCHETGKYFAGGYAIKFLKKLKENVF